MKFICILLLSICCQSHASASERVSHGNTNEFQQTISKQVQPDADQPIALSDCRVGVRYSIVKKIAGVSTLPGAVLTLPYITNLPVPVMAVAGIHVKNYLRHIYPAMHFW